MSDKKQEDKLLADNYDGIEEYDNDLPRWWVWLFVLTIVWSGVYIVWFHGNPENLTEQRIAQDMKLLQELRDAHKAKTSGSASPQAAAVLTDDAMFQLAKDSSHVSKGAAVFIAKCAACHGQKGEGLIGPNLTDANWIHGATPTIMRSIIENGVLPKGMLAWKGVISDDEITSVIAYMISIHGSNPPNAKKAEGEIVSSW